MPLTQGIKLLKAASLGLSAENTAVPVIVIVVLAAVCTGISIRFFRWE
jgi:ABC-2 type transport system permease protein